MKEINNKDFVITVVGVGYVGQPLINEFARTKKVYAYDIDSEKIKALGNNNKNDNIVYTNNSKCIGESDAVIVAVPTPTYDNNNPNLEFVINACKTIGDNLRKNTLIVFESSYYPGVTEDICIPLLEENSSLKNNIDFFVGYSPERINPSDKIHTINTITKVISAQNNFVLDQVEKLYSLIPDINLYRTTSIKVAELSKIIENSQRDLNIAFVNEVSQLCHLMNISTIDVLETSKTKWNFVDVFPGLVGGHCIGVDPYYLMDLGKKYGYNMNLVEQSRKTNEKIPLFIVHSLNSLLNNIKKENIKVGILGYSYKANSDDIRNTKVELIYDELKKQHFDCMISDYMLFDKNTNFNNYRELHDLDVLIIAVPHDKYRNMSKEKIISYFNKSSSKKIILDLYSVYKNYNFGSDVIYWTL